MKRSKTDYAIYIRSSLKDMRDLARIRESLIRPGAHGTCSALLCNLPWNTRVSLRKEKSCKAIPGNILARLLLKTGRTIG